MSRFRRATLLLLAVAIACGPASAQDHFAAIDSIVNQGIADHLLPGAVVVVGHSGRVVFRRAYGMRSLEPTQERMTLDTIFDMASLTKPLMTATAIMQLYQHGKLAFDEPVAKYLPAFGANGKQTITIRELLTHYSGLPPDLSLNEPWEGKGEAYRRAFAVAPAGPAGEKFVYSDINYVVLGALVEKLSGLPLDEYTRRYIIEPLGLKHTRYLPPESWIPRIAPTQYEHGASAYGVPGLPTGPGDVMLRGVVHDPTSRRMGGVAGHAGLFSTADDMAVYAQNLLDRLAGRPSKFPLSQAVLRKMVAPEQPAGGKAVRGFGWDIDSPYSSNRGSILPVGSFGHTGFTGTSLWIDPADNTYVIVLANSVHPNGPKRMTVLRGRIADAAAMALGIHPKTHAQVKTGIDVLESDGFRELAELAHRHGGRLRLGLLTNQTGVDATGRRTIDVLFHDAAKAVPGLALNTVFSPEHGLGGALDQPTVPSSTDAATGLPVISLYGTKDSDRRPTPDSLRALDAVAVDLQDVGVRFYTYEAVLRYFLEAAAQTGTEIVVLDRPDPITGSHVQGPISDAGTESYVNSVPVPVRHGMTLGELARYDTQQLRLHIPLTVVAVQGWRLGEWQDATGLTWVNPSPNLRSMEEAALYPGVGLIETTNISVGRGTDTPFEIVGAPWMDADGLKQFLDRRHVPGVTFAPADFTPQKPYPYGGEVCHGVRITAADRDALDAPELGIELASAFHQLYPRQFQLQKMNTLLANRSVLDAIAADQDPRRIAEGWRAALMAFGEKRNRALIYAR
ncbi:MAG TPA: serine hydrolase [Acidobacteriaceae bacterium]|jgi:uncharacterized protein YbbC (DUF1343 family)|nr:serine hydrolase [Acidobacteriaceae bacterium]